MRLPCYVKAETKVKYGVADTCRKHKTYVWREHSKKRQVCTYLVSSSYLRHLEPQGYNIGAKFIRMSLFLNPTSTTKQASRLF